MRVILTGGGTGGHIYPALAIGEKIKQMEPDSEILYIGNDHGLEKKIVPEAGYDFRIVDARWFRKQPVEILKTAVAVRKGTRKALKIMKEFRPDVVIGTGGYVCFPVMYAGHKYGAKCYVHEQNAFPGKANRSLERFADRVFLGFGAAAEYFKDKDKLVVTGNPVRDCFFHIDRAESREKLGIPRDDFVVFSFAGSQGANHICEVVYDLMKQLNGRQGVTLLFATGPLHYDEVMEKVKSTGLRVEDNVRIESYINNMEDYLGAADLIISRSGALSVAETCVCGRAAILIPSPNVTGNHQYYNAKAVADCGGAILTEEKDLTMEGLLNAIDRFMEHPEELRQMEQAAYEAAPRNATDVVYENIRARLDGAGK